MQQTAQLGVVAESGTGFEVKVDRDGARPQSGTMPPAPPGVTDVWIYRAVVGILGVVVVAPLVGELTGRSISPEIITLGSTAVGALAGLLAPSPKQP